MPAPAVRRVVARKSHHAHESYRVDAVYKLLYDYNDTSALTEVSAVAPNMSDIMTFASGSTCHATFVPTACDVPHTSESEEKY